LGATDLIFSVSGEATHGSLSGADSGIDIGLEGGRVVVRHLGVWDKNQEVLRWAIR